MDLDPDAIARGTDPGSGSAPKCHGSPTLVDIVAFIGLFDTTVSLSFELVIG